MSTDATTGGQATTDRLALLSGEVKQLLASGKAKQAIERVKDLHKHSPSPQTEGLLVDAYVARIQQFQSKGAAQDAQTLIDLVRQRFPSHRHRLAGLTIQTLALGGNIDAVVAPLAQPGITPELRASIEAAIQQRVTDLHPLAHALTLPPDHPLRMAAMAGLKAFEAVTTRQVTDAEIELPEISRRSPLAGWKMLIRAIAAFHRHHDDACRHALAQIPDESIVKRLAPVLTAMMLGRTSATGMDGALESRIGGNDDALRQALAEVELATRHQAMNLFVRSSRKAIDECQRSYPELTERLRQQIGASAYATGAAMEQVQRAIGNMRLDAHAWRLLAHGAERAHAKTTAVFCWERYLRHAGAEGIFAADSSEASAVWARAAGLLAALGADEFHEERLRLHDVSRWYVGQPPEIAALAPKPQTVHEWADATRLFDLATLHHPDAEVFRAWWAWTQRSRNAHLQERAAKTWSQRLPRDPQPLLYLSALAEDRKAIKTGLDYLLAAEAIDAMNPQVRKARVRLTLANLWRHFKDARLHLAEKDLTALSDLVKEGDRAAFVDALWLTWHAARGEMPRAIEICAGVADRLGPLLAPLSIRHAMFRANVAAQFPALAIATEVVANVTDLARAEARRVRLNREMNVQIPRVPQWAAMLRRELGGTATGISQEDLLAIAQGAAEESDSHLVYLATGAGLARSRGAMTGQFLLLRAGSFPQFADGRISQCLRAAREMALQSHDPDLLAAVAEAIDGHWATQRSTTSNPGSISDEILSSIIEAERKATSYTAEYAALQRHVVLVECEHPTSGFFDDEDDGDDGPFDAEDEFDDGEDEDLDFDLPAPESLPPVLQDLLKKYGHFPTPEEIQRGDPALFDSLMELVKCLAGGKGAGRFDDRRRKRRR